MTSLSNAMCDLMAKIEFARDDVPMLITGHRLDIPRYSQTKHIYRIVFPLDDILSSLGYMGQEFDHYGQESA